MRSGGEEGEGRGRGREGEGARRQGRTEGAPSNTILSLDAQSEDEGEVTRRGSVGGVRSQSVRGVKYEGVRSEGVRSEGCEE